MTDEEIIKIMEKTNNLWNDRKRLEQLEKENEQLKKKLCLMRKYIYGNYDLEYKEMQLQHIDEFGSELKVVRKSVTP